MEFCLAVGFERLRTLLAAFCFINGEKVNEGRYAPRDFYIPHYESIR